MTMSEKITFDAELIRRYDRSGPRYTSYPTAVSRRRASGYGMVRWIAVICGVSRWRRWWRNP